MEVEQVGTDWQEVGPRHKTVKGKPSTGPSLLCGLLLCEPLYPIPVTTDEASPKPLHYGGLAFPETRCQINISSLQVFFQVSVTSRKVSN